MKVVKLDRRHNLHYKGYTHALRYGRRNEDANKVVSALSRLYGEVPWNNRGSHPWTIQRSDRRSRPTFWIGVKDEKMLTIALMAKG